MERNISHNMRKTNKIRYIAWYSWINILIVIAGEHGGGGPEIVEQKQECKQCTESLHPFQPSGRQQGMKSWISSLLIVKLFS